ncbi:GTP cyclohydrolase I [Leucobacter chromiireducens]|uniref:GTP cyclohydrolase 1 n=1 Tax=Leucobacter chromiireducens subsp. chromiireducens TaxID=660067 RepID=A0ABS1SNR0_9MICO|nr:GTP cyclohydrolase I [Leucobacter chromiireducens]MBL3689619.1 GTP cyclohydrolase I [Leucobacter chromiireducens subsp. chromiireducens]
MNETVDRERIAAAVREMLSAIGSDPDSPELASTPFRVADAYAEFFAGVGTDPAGFLSDAVPVGADTGELVLVRDIALRSMCEHHLLPFRGRAHVAYRPGSRVVGLSAIPRVIDTLAARPQVQERLGEQIAQTLEDGLAPAGVLVVLEASHGCVSDRGVRQADAVTMTVASRGVLADPAEQAAIFALLGCGSGAVATAEADR